MRGRPKLTREQVINKFWSNVEKTDSCWIWVGGKVENGYGRFATAKNHGICDSRYAHRIAYSLTFDDYNSNMNVCHKCDNPSCVNPDHLFLGTQSDNIKDCASKGRLGLQINPTRGERHSSAKLNWQKVKEIRDSGDSAKSLAERYGVHETTIRDILNNRTWVE